MNDVGSSGLKLSAGMYWEALRELATHVYSRIKFLRLVYERMKMPRPLPQPIRSVLFVCMGNVCRSPLAAAYFGEEVRKNRCMIRVNSAGIDTHLGKPAHALAEEIAYQQGFSLQYHSTTPLSQDLIEQSDLVLVMEIAQKDRLFRLYPRERHKVFLLGQFCRKGSLDIDDPYCGTHDDFKVCFERIREACDRLIHTINEQA
jgi:protein-tyrosine phosphatase